jgi:tetraacyldisaccharide 4'-kinase
MPSLVERVWGDERLPFRAARAALTPMAWTFEAVTRGRSLLYDRGVMRARRATVPVVSVGNLRVGGTGKTPLVMWLVERLAARGVRAAVVARGYGAEGAEPAVISTSAVPVRRGVEPDLGTVRRAHVDAGGRVEKTGSIADEPLLVALRTLAPVVTAVDRWEACRLAALAFAPDVVLLDDGFQHRRLWRDLDIVLVDAADRAAPVLPAGPLREPWRALDRADVVISTSRTAAMPWLARRAMGLVDRVSHDVEIQPLGRIAGARVVAVAGVARAAEFLTMLRSTGADVAEVLEFGDHHAYGDEDWRRIARAAAGARSVVTTEKDLVKLADFAAPDVRMCALRLEVDVSGADASALVDLLLARARLDPKQRGQHDRELRA